MVSGLPFLDFGARQYDPSLGSWLTQDPLAKDYPSLSPYAYCAADPVNIVDPKGMEWEDKNSVITVYLNVTNSAGLTKEQESEYKEALSSMSRIWFYDRKKFFRI